MSEVNDSHSDVESESSQDVESESSQDDELSESSQDDELPESEKIKETKGPDGKIEWRCRYCDKKLFSRQNRDYHEAIAVCFKTLYTCSRCLGVFVSPWFLERHQTALRRCEKLDKVIIERNGKRYIRTPYT